MVVIPSLEPMDGASLPPYEVLLEEGSSFFFSTLSGERAGAVGLLLLFPVVVVVVLLVGRGCRSAKTILSGLISV